MDKVELIYNGHMKDGKFVYGAEAICPECGNGNAMLHKSDIVYDNNGETSVEEWYECRDCAYIVLKKEAVTVKRILDKPGMGAKSTYTIIEKVDMLTGNVFTHKKV